MEPITILGIPYIVEEVDCVDKHEPCQGMIDFEKCWIKIDKNLPLALKNQVLMHEIVHAILELLGYKEDSEDEQKVQGLATALHLLLQPSAPTFFF